jgi:OOP family OmpA-OmpF porin
VPNQRSAFRLWSTATVLAGVLLSSAPAGAQNSGFTVNRYEPTAAGEWSFWVDHPWYSSTRYFAAGITLNYAHNPLIFGRVSPDGSFTQTTSVIEHQLLGHVDLAGSFLDRVLITGTLPITFLERGTTAAGVSPTTGVVVGDPRFGLWIRLFGQPYRSAISMSIGANVWVPLRAFDGTKGVSETSSDQGVRVMPKIVLGGLASRVMWSFTGGFLYRPAARIGVGVDDAGSTVGSELQLGAAIAYADTTRRFAIGPEAIMSTVILGTDAVQPFTREFTSLEILLGFHYNIARIINIGAAGGLGVLRTPGTPDARALFRLAYAPIRDLAPKDRDKDGIPDVKDACPDTPGIETDDAQTNGCPDRDRDYVVDKIDLCPDTPKGPRPDPNRLGCPIGDRDRDEVLDPEDLCPDTPKGPRPDPNRLGCPMGDRDSDGVLDADDQCPDVPKGEKPDPNRTGCPAGDRDGDAVVDHEDQCPDVHKGPKPDPNRLGCPYGDRDKDTVIDPEDACPDQPGAPHPDPKKNGCPGLVMVQDGQIKILQPVFFATNKDVILQKSYPVLQSVADALKVTKEIKKVAIEGHTDNRGKAEYNRALSDRRAKSVMKWLVTTGGIEESRLEAKGYGPDRPIADNKTPKGREKNRRVDFVILDPPQAKNVQTQNPKDVVVPESPDQSDKSGKKGGTPGAKGAAAPKGAAPKGAAPKGAAPKGAAPKKPAGAPKAKK